MALLWDLLVGGTITLPTCVPFDLSLRCCRQRSPNGLDVQCVDPGKLADDLTKAEGAVKHTSCDAKEPGHAQGRLMGRGRQV